ncbi:MULTISPECIES: ABC transporter permease subunit [Pantoea]|jgi:phosphate transport system permease protein|uniref:ABC transporter permease subunit n=1 Tax=Pantoea TaxID=53335 RepID=UPI000EA186CC|nr:MULTISPECIES: ABC transporter permease subunit [Pantoea]MBZ6387097.1 ABC transporter permease subunit [Pantoea piersonii]MBZ6400404.1 ABC transporter permease subunit [Pantoea piersonii]MBZ6409380.1 ABC transporter permease subunit [Pantoea piersonii]MBZ6427233.1 ABC transporter permease subunit [Pantoea piersonii]NYB03844.1 ABC transporter permease subunit [Pantoea piersonii]
MSLKHIPVNFSDRRRRAIDRFTRRLVTSCGIAILLLMLLLFFWLIWVVLPLFAAPGVHPQAAQRLWDSEPALIVGNQGDRGWRIGQDGAARFIPLNGQPAETPLMLRPAPQQAVSSADQRTLLLNAQGALTLLQPVDGAWRYPLGDTPLRLPDGAIKAMALAALNETKWRVSVLTDAGLRVLTLAPQQAPRIIELPQAHADHLLLSPQGDLLYASEGNVLRVWQLDDDRATLRETVTLAQTPRSLHLLAGGRSLLIQDGRGVTQWFAIAGAVGPRLHEIRTFAGSSPTADIVTETQRRVFATLEPGGALKLFASKQPGPVLQRQLAPGIESAAFSPRGDALLLERAGSWQVLRLDNPWPDVSWRSFWQKIWYENYPAPDWVWQSTNAADSYQAKFSFMPMVTGTLKAAALSLLFATPLALAAAMYTAWFMAPGLRRWVKPAIEMMGALPSVVIGLIAGLWLAPHISQALLGVLLLPLTLAATLLICGALSRHLPPRWRQPGREVMLLLPLLLIVTLATLIIPTFLMRDAAEWLPHYEQRNLLVAGLAMGFALVPLIFTLSEDALFSVPAALGQGSLALGATPWQTLTRVVLPGASAGIFAALMIGFGRAVGETMIVLMATGNTPQSQGGLFSGLRALSANIAIEMPEAAAGSAHYRILFLSALMLLVFTLIINTLAELIRQRLRQRYSQHEGQA